MQQTRVKPEGQQLSNVVNTQTQDCILKRMATNLDQTAAKLAGQGDMQWDYRVHQYAFIAHLLQLGK